MINRVIMMGRLTRDPEVHETTSGVKISNLRLVTNEYRKGEDGQRREDSQFHSVVAFGRLGEICAEYLHKGRLIYIEGKLRTREWDGRDGIKRYTTEIVADQMQMVGPRPGDVGSDSNGSLAEDIEDVQVTAGASA